MKYDVESHIFIQKVVLLHLSFRVFSVLLFVLCISFVVALLHILVEKCREKYWSNEISDSEVVENQEADEQHSFCDFYTAVNSIVMISLILIIIFSLKYHLLPLRISLLLKDSNNILACMIAIPNYYFKNPLLRHYVWKKIMRISTVHPENNQMELQSMWTELNKIHFISTTKLTFFI